MCVRYGLKQLIFKMIAGKSNDNRHETQGENREITLKKTSSKRSTAGTLLTRLTTWRDRCQLLDDNGAEMKKIIYGNFTPLSPCSCKFNTLYLAELPA